MTGCQWVVCRHCRKRGKQGPHFLQPGLLAFAGRDTPGVLNEAIKKRGRNKAIGDLIMGQHVNHRTPVLYRLIQGLRPVDTGALLLQVLGSRKGLTARYQNRSGQTCRYTITGFRHQLLGRVTADGGPDGGLRSDAQSPADRAGKIV